VVCCNLINDLLQRAFTFVFYELTMVGRTQKNKSDKLLKNTMQCKKKHMACENAALT
jgi:hypothetical protein